MSVTAAAMIDETLGTLLSWSSSQEQSTTLASPMTSGALSGTVTTLRSQNLGINTGIVEIGTELIFVSDLTTSGNTFTIPAWGRGFRSTTPAAHSTGDRVLSQPLFPRAKLLDQMNETIRRIFPDLFAVKMVEKTTTFPVVTYDLPDDCMRVLKVRWLVPDGRSYWQDVKRWRLSTSGGTGAGALGDITVDIDPRGIMPGRRIQFLYAASPGVFASEADDFVTATGLDEGLRDVVELGAASMATQALELSRLQTAAIEQQNRSQLVAPAAALTSSGFLEKRFKTRVAEEAKALRQLYPPRITREWV